MSGEAKEANVTYTVRELLAKIEGKLDGVIITIGQKADKHEVENLDDRVKRLEKAIFDIDAAKQRAEEVASTLADKQKAERTWWELWRAKVGWLGGGVVVVASFHSSFPHVF